MKGIPEAEIRRLAVLPGIAKMEGRIVQDVCVIFPGREDNAFLRLITVGLRQEKQISRVKLLAGLPLDPHRPGIWVDPQFLAANELKKRGDSSHYWWQKSISGNSGTGAKSGICLFHAQRSGSVP
ncbi:MAG: hypothetical protein DDT19_00194 [Syntrophomonadaceae bacterium]|nr:hypothetical protein [Bacillota bacterium]